MARQNGRNENAALTGSDTVSALQKLALGSAQFGLDYGAVNRGGIVAQSALEKIIDFARSCEIKTIDTAISYGTSEENLGRVGVEDFELITKLPRLPRSVVDAKEWVVREVAGSLSRLRVGCLEGVLLHFPADLEGSHAKGIINGLQQVIDRGFSKKVGLSIYEEQDLKQVYHRLKVDIVQTPFNVFDRRIEKSGWLKILASDGVEVHSRSTFLQGLLLADISNLPPQFNRWMPFFSSWSNYLSTLKSDAMQESLRCPLSIPEIDKIVIGVDSTRQLAEIVNAASKQEEASGTQIDFSCEDLGLIDPRRWVSAK